MLSPPRSARARLECRAEPTIDQESTLVQKLHLFAGVPRHSMWPRPPAIQACEAAGRNQGAYMLNSSFSLLPHKPWELILLTLIALGVGASPAWADVVTDWDAKISSVASPAALGEREAAIADLAMFDAVNSVLRQYPGYVTREDGFEHAS